MNQGSESDPVNRPNKKSAKWTIYLVIVIIMTLIVLIASAVIINNLIRLSNSGMFPLIEDAMKYNIN
jgi:hypothetical protein